MFGRYAQAPGDLEGDSASLWCPHACLAGSFPVHAAHDDEDRACPSLLPPRDDTEVPLSTGAFPRPGAGLSVGWVQGGLSR